MLVIDDNEVIRAYLSALTQDHAETIEAASGDKGISVTKSRVPNLILLDLLMPGSDGCQVYTGHLWFRSGNPDDGYQ